MPPQSRINQIGLKLASQWTELWEEPTEDLDWPEQLVRRLVDRVLELAGHANIVAELPKPQVLVERGWTRFTDERDSALA
jgi:hypothetical protein